MGRLVFSKTCREWKLPISRAGWCQGCFPGWLRPLRQALAELPGHYLLPWVGGVPRGLPYRTDARSPPSVFPNLGSEPRWGEALESAAKNHHRFY